MSYIKKDGKLSVELDDGSVVTLIHGGFGFIFTIERPEPLLNGELVITWMEDFDGPVTEYGYTNYALCSALAKLYPSLHETYID